MAAVSILWAKTGMWGEQSLIPHIVSQIWSLALIFVHILLWDIICYYNFKPYPKMTTDLYYFFSWTFA